MKAKLSIYEFSKKSVQDRDLEPFLKQYSQHKQPVGTDLRAMVGGMIFSLAGYESDERELFAIGEVRRFYRAFHEAWPYWLYFCDLEQDDLRTMTFCCLSSLVLIQPRGQSNGSLIYDRRELDQFLQADLAGLRELGERAELSMGAITRRANAVLAYFQVRYRPSVKA